MTDEQKNEALVERARKEESEVAAITETRRRGDFAEAELLPWLHDRQ